MDLQLTGKRALICGGSSGLGQAVARALVAEGAHVALLSRDASKLQAVADELNAMGPGRAVIAPADLADHEGLLKAVDTAEAALGGPIQILLNNTGGPPPSGVAGLDPALWREQFEAMVLSVFRLTDRVLPGMRSMGLGARSERRLHLRHRADRDAGRVEHPARLGGGLGQDPGGRGRGQWRDG